MIQKIMISAATNINFKKIILILLVSIPLVCFSQETVVPPGQKVFVTNDKITPVPVTITNPTSSIGQSAIIPYRKNISAISPTKIDESKDKYMWVIEYIAAYVEGQLEYILIEIHSGDRIPVTLRFSNPLLSMPMKLRLAQGESLVIYAVAKRPGNQNVARADIHVSGYYEPIPQ